MSNSAPVKRPSLFQFALAGVLIQLKPQSLDIQQFVSGLREKVSDQRGQIDYGNPQFLDGIQYLRSRLIEAEAKIAELEAQKSILEQIKNPTEAQAMGDLLSAVLNRPLARSIQGSQRGRFETTAAQTSDKQLDYWTNGEMRALLGPPLDTSIAHHILQICKSIQRTPINSQALSGHLTQMSSEMSATLLKHCHKLAQPYISYHLITSNNSEVQEATHHAALIRKTSDSIIPCMSRCLAFMLQACTDFQQDGESSEMIQKAEGSIIYAVVKVLEMSMHMMTLLCLSSAHANTRTAQETSQNSLGRGSVRKTRTKTESQDKETDALVEVAKKIQSFVLVGLCHLIPTQRIHREIFEGFMFLILDLSGDHLRYLKFGHAESNDYAKMIDTLGDYNIASGVKHALQRTSDEVRRTAVHLEIAITGRLLEQVSTLLTSFLGPIEDARQLEKRRVTRSKSMKSPATVTKRTLQPPHKSKLSILVRERLQQTLINSMFPPTDAGTGDSVVECLRLPPYVNAPQLMRSQDEHELMEQAPDKWFFNKVWDLVGWDILLREDE